MNAQSRTVTFVPLGRTSNALPDETVLDAARRAGVPLGNSCGAIGICGRCRIRVLAGDDHLSSPTSIELRTASTRGFEPDERLACMAVVRGDCAVTTGYWGDGNE
ncbi:MAG: ferredoxin [Acidobacteria bacterium]|nr:ferredoxin [Acidobacteriota bacterium]